MDRVGAVCADTKLSRRPSKDRSPSTITSTFASYAAIRPADHARRRSRSSSHMQVRQPTARGASATSISARSTCWPQYVATTGPNSARIACQRSRASGCSAPGLRSHPFGGVLATYQAPGSRVQRESALTTRSHTVSTWAEPAIYRVIATSIRQHADGRLRVGKRAGHLQVTWTLGRGLPRRATMPRGRSSA
jgi:hypothetical protein